MIIEVKNVTKFYRKNKSDIKVIESFSYTFEHKNLYLIKGSSGKGKTTLMSLIGLLDNPTSGEIYFDGERVDTKNSKQLCDIRRDKVAFVFQEYSLLERLTVYENIKLVFEETPDLKMDQKIDDILEKLQLSHRKYHLAGELSGGEKQRTALARAIVKKHSVLICDEPISNVDEENARMIIQILKESSKEKLVIVTCHSNDFDDICDKRIDL